MASPSAAHGDVEEDYKEEGREDKENEHRGPKDKKKGMKSYTVGKKLSAIAKFDECGGNMVKAARDSGVDAMSLTEAICPSGKTACCYTSRYNGTLLNLDAACNGML